ncbi:class I SAM-dependent methyltransferase [Rhodohalobacter sp. SW132]|uniref:class I SAM-dependent methyltransferase n=1 Tax=Rhodohalobacter sp. SW132 TaxID=2293433 RepID=UPI000E220CB0|nr:class I SAM-dependent methyltransferase [Rhodohalobacter sp. SW132]REL38505.1 class I SAM-dependent methyltransferase [Rhodohalobacter sp. SW132]
MPDRDRLDREKEFHNEAFATGKRKNVKKYYKTTDLSKSFYREKIHENVAGLSVLEYGCGPGSQAFDLAKAGASITAIDISDVAIEQTKKEADRQGVEIECFVMDGEDLSFDKNSFNRVCGSGILHHLDLERCYPELKRVLIPGGNGIFFEPMGYNPLINLYRNMTPGLRTDDEHPLLNEDFELAEKYFDEVNPAFFHLTSIGASFVPVAFLQSALARPLNGLDSVLFKTLPFLKKYAWITVLELKTTKQDLSA